MMSRRISPDVVVIGAGPAGLAAAASAAERGRRVLLVDQGARAGGQIWRHRDESALPRRAHALLARLRAANVAVTSGAAVVDIAPSRELIVDFSGRIAAVDTSAVVIATGARERFLPFPGWTLPRVVGVGGLQALIKSGIALRGTRVAISGTGPLLLAVAATAARAGAHLVFVGEQVTRTALLRFGVHAAASPLRLVDAARYRAAFARTMYRTDSWVTAARGDGRLRSIVVSRGGNAAEIECDWLACAWGLVPATDIARVAGCAANASGIAVDHLQRTSVEGIFAAGECTGVKGDAAAVVEGEIAGLAAAGDVAAATASRLQRARTAGIAFGRLLSTTFVPRAELLALATPATIVCRCEDVTMQSLDPAWTQRQAKLWTRIGMGACQGAVCGPACSAMFGWEENVSRSPVGAPPCGPWAAALRGD